MDVADIFATEVANAVPRWRRPADRSMFHVAPRAAALRVLGLKVVLTSGTFDVKVTAKGSGRISLAGFDLLPVRTA